MDAVTQMATARLEEYRDMVRRGDQVPVDTISSLIEELQACPVADQAALAEHFADTLAESDRQTGSSTVYRAVLSLFFS